MSSDRSFECGQVSLVQPVPVGMPVLAANHRDESEQTQNSPHERIQSGRQHDRHDHYVEDDPHELMVVPSTAYAAFLSAASSSPTISVMLHTCDEVPASIAGVTLLAILT